MSNVNYTVPCILHPATSYDSKIFNIAYMNVYGIPIYEQKIEIEIPNLNIAISGSVLFFNYLAEKMGENKYHIPDELYYTTHHFKCIPLAICDMFEFGTIHSHHKNNFGFYMVPINASTEYIQQNIQSKDNLYYYNRKNGMCVYNSTYYPSVFVQFSKENKLSMQTTLFCKKIQNNNVCVNIHNVPIIICLWIVGLSKNTMNETDEYNVSNRINAINKVNDVGGISYPIKSISVNINGIINIYTQTTPQTDVQFINHDNYYGAIIPIIGTIKDVINFLSTNDTNKRNDIYDKFDKLKQLSFNAETFNLEINIETSMCGADSYLLVDTCYFLHNNI